MLDLFISKYKKPNFGNYPNEKTDEKEKNLADVHSDIKNKIDALIAKHEKEEKFKKEDFNFQEKPNNSSEEIIEIRGSLKRKRLAARLKSQNAFDVLNSKEEMFEITPENGVRSGSEVDKNLQESENEILNAGNGRSSSQTSVSG